MIPGMYVGVSKATPSNLERERGFGWPCVYTASELSWKTSWLATQQFSGTDTHDTVCMSPESSCAKKNFFFSTFRHVHDVVLVTLCTRLPLFLKKTCFDNASLYIIIILQSIIDSIARCRALSCWVWSYWYNAGLLLGGCGGLLCWRCHLRDKEEKNRVHRNITAETSHCRLWKAPQRGKSSTLRAIKLEKKSDSGRHVARLKLN